MNKKIGVHTLIILGVMMFAGAGGSYTAEAGPIDASVQATPIDARVDADPVEAQATGEMERMNADASNLAFEGAQLQEKRDFLDRHCVGAQANPANIAKCNAAESYVNAHSAAYEQRLAAHQEAAGNLTR